MGIMLWTTVRILQAALANKILEKRFSEWLSDRSIQSGMRSVDIGLTVLFSSTVMLLSKSNFLSCQ